MTWYKAHQTLLPCVAKVRVHIKHCNLAESRHSTAGPTLPQIGHMSPKNKGTDNLRTLIEDFPLPYIAMFVYRRLLYGNIFSMEIAILLLITLLPYVAMFDLFVGLLQSVAAQIGPLVPMAHHRKCSSLLGPAANKPDLIACDGQRQVDQGWVNTHGMMSSFGKTAWLTHFFPMKMWNSYWYHWLFNGKLPLLLSQWKQGVTTGLISDVLAVNIFENHLPRQTCLKYLHLLMFRGHLALSGNGVYPTLTSLYFNGLNGIMIAKQQWFMGCNPFSDTLSHDTRALTHPITLLILGYKMLQESPRKQV